jgi:hypothetical protein
MPNRLLFVLIDSLVCNCVLWAIHYDWRARKYGPPGPRVGPHCAKAKFKSNGDKASPYFRPLWIENALLQLHWTQFHRYNTLNKNVAQYLSSNWNIGFQEVHKYHMYSPIVFKFFPVSDHQNIWSVVDWLLPNYPTILSTSGVNLDKNLG